MKLPLSAMLFVDKNARFDARLDPSLLFRVYDWAGDSQRKWKTVSVFPFCLQMQISLKGRSIYSACSPKGQCHVIVAFRLYILFLDLDRFLLLFLSYLGQLVSDFHLLAEQFVQIVYTLLLWPFLAGIVLVSLQIPLMRLLALPVRLPFRCRKCSCGGNPNYGQLKMTCL